MEVAREYADEGLATLMAGNVRDNRADIASLPKMDSAVLRAVARNRLSKGDVLLVRTGAN